MPGPGRKSTKARAGKAEKSKSKSRSRAKDKGKAKSGSKKKAKGKAKRGPGRPRKKPESSDTDTDDNVSVVNRIIVDPPDFSDGSDDVPKGKIRTWSLVSVYVDGVFKRQFPWDKLWKTKSLYSTGIFATELLDIIATELSIPYDDLISGLNSVEYTIYEFRSNSVLSPIKYTVLIFTGGCFSSFVILYMFIVCYTK